MRDFTNTTVGCSQTRIPNPNSLIRRTHRWVQPERWFIIGNLESTMIRLDTRNSLAILIQLMGYDNAILMMLLLISAFIWADTLLVMEKIVLCFLRKWTDIQDYVTKIFCLGDFQVNMSIYTYSWNSISWALSSTVFNSMHVMLYVKIFKFWT